MVRAGCLRHEPTGSSTFGPWIPLELVAGQLPGVTRRQTPVWGCPSRGRPSRGGSHDEQVHPRPRPPARSRGPCRSPPPHPPAHLVRNEASARGMPLRPAQMTTAPRSRSQGDRLDLQNLAGLRRGHDPAPGLAVLPERPALLRRQRFEGIPGVDGPDETWWSRGWGVGRIHDDHGEQGDHLDAPAAAGSELLLNQVPDHAPGAGVEDVQRVRLGALVGPPPVATATRPAARCCGRRRCCARRRGGDRRCR